MIGALVQLAHMPGGSEIYEVVATYSRWVTLKSLATGELSFAEAVDVWVWRSK